MSVLNRVGMALNLALVILIIYTLPIWGGDQNVTSEDFPFFTFLKIHGNGDLKECGGALISPKYVLTAGACLNNALKVTVFLGLKDMLNLTNVVQQTASRLQLHVHPEYEEDQLCSNIGLIQLPEKVNLTKEINVIKLPSTIWDNPDIFDYTLMNATGFGPFQKDFDRIKRTMHLKYRPVNKMDNTKCNDYFSENYDNFFIDDYSVCTSKGPNDKYCHDDMGSPLSLNVSGDRYLIGIETWFEEECSSEDPEVYANVAKHLNWINTVTDISLS